MIWQWPSGKTLVFSRLAIADTEQYERWRAATVVPLDGDVEPGKEDCT